ncbi:transposase [Streptomyces sp. NPDC049881]|uniref:transposase n=1 Tax=unclassified Streptomyces TaxID=2593676 RepID=UPI0034192DBF
MGRRPALPVEDKVDIVLGVLSGSVSAAEAARRNSLSGQTISVWKRTFVDGGRASLAGARCAPADDVLRLTRELEQLRAALGAAEAELGRLRRDDA